MSTIFIPYVYHNNIDNKFYMVQTTKPIGTPNNNVVTSTVFNTGVKLSRSVDFDNAYLFLIEMLMLYDTCYISLDDLVYLYAVIGKEEIELLIKSTAIKVYNSQSTKLGLHKFADKFRVSVESQDITQSNIKKKITKMVSLYPPTNVFKEWYIKSIQRTLGDTFYINDLKSILDNTAKTSLEELLNSNTMNIIDQSKDEETSTVDYKQIKMNRLLHFHFYLNLTKHIGCDHIYIPEELNGLYDYYDIKNINKNNLENVFQNVKSLEQIPDVAQLVKIGELSISDIAVNLANSLHVDYIQYRPASLTYFVEDEVWENAEKAVNEAILHKESNLQVFNAGIKWKHVVEDRKYSKCITSSMVSVIKANGDIPLCVLKRNESSSIIGNIYNGGFLEHWYSEKHYSLIENIDVGKCRKPCKHDSYNIVAEAYADDLYHKNFI